MTSFFLPASFFWVKALFPHYKNHLQGKVFRFVWSRIASSDFVKEHSRTFSDNTDQKEVSGGLEEGKEGTMWLLWLMQKLWGSSDTCISSLQAHQRQMRWRDPKELCWASRCCFEFLTAFFLGDYMELFTVACLKSEQCHISFVQYF